MPNMCYSKVLMLTNINLKQICILSGGRGHHCRHKMISTNTFPNYKFQFTVKDNQEQEVINWKRASKKKEGKEKNRKEKKRKRKKKAQ